MSESEKNECAYAEFRGVSTQELRRRLLMLKASSYSDPWYTERREIKIRKLEFELRYREHGLQS